MAADVFEPNDTFSDAKDLTSTVAVNIEPAGDIDVFRWKAPSSGYVRFDALFDHGQGDIDVRLYNSSLTQIDASISGDDNERVGTAVSQNDELFVHIAEFSGTKAVPYTLQPTFIRPDAFESNDNIASATKLGGGEKSISNLNIHAPGDKDYYSWTASADGLVSVSASFSHFDGDLGLRVLNTSGVELTSSQTMTDNELASLNVVAGVTYIIEVVESQGQEHPGYRLGVKFNSPPVITDFPDGAVLGPIGGTTLVNFSVDDSNNPLSTLSVTATSSDKSLVPDGNISIFGSGADRQAVINSPGGFGITTITVTVSDPDGGSTSDSFQLWLFTDNTSSPVISSISDVSVAENGTSDTLRFTVSDAQTAPNNLAVTATSSNTSLVPNTSNNIILSGSGTNRTIRIRPASNQTGTAVITVRVTDADSDASSTSFRVSVFGLANLPTITRIDDVTIDAGTSTGPIPFTISDADTPVWALSVTATSSDQSKVPNSGILISGSGADRTVTVTPAVNARGTATITLSVSDGSATATESFNVSIATSTVNNRPTISFIPDRTIQENSSMPTTPFTVGDVETDPDDLAITIGTNNPFLLPISNIVLGGSGSHRTVSATPIPNRQGAAIVTLTVVDGDGGTDEETFVLIVLAEDNLPNRAPVSVDDFFGTSRDVTLNVAAPGVMSNDYDPDTTDTLSVESLVSDVQNGSLALNADGSFQYVPNAGFQGADSFTYRATDGTNSGNVATVNITVGPIVEAHFDSGAEGFTYIDDVFRATNAPTYASGAFLANGGRTGGGLQVLVGGIDDADIRSMSGGWQRTFNLAAPTDVTVSLQYNMTQATGYETDELSQALLSIDGVLYGTPPNDFMAQIVGDGNSGSDLTTGWQPFTVNVGALGVGTHTITIGGYNNKKTLSDESTAILIDDVVVTRSVQNTPPTAQDDNYHAAAGQRLSVPSAAGVLANDTDVDGDALRVSSPVSNVSNGSLILNPNGSFVYTPNAAFEGVDSFTYRATDGSSISNVARVAITVTTSNTPPVASDDSYSIDQDMTLSVNAVSGVLANDSDADGDTLTAVVVTGPTNGSLTLDPDGSFQYIPHAGFSGSDSFAYAAHDGTVLSNTAVVTIRGVGPALRTGQVTNATTDGWVTVDLDHDYAAMVVIATPNYDSSSVPLVTRIQNASGSSFQVKLDRADGQSGTVKADVHYLVAEAGVYTAAQHGATMEVVRFSSSVTDYKTSWVGTAQSYANGYTNPVVLGQVMTYNDPGFSVFWARGSSVNSPPTNTELFVGKHVAEDTVTTRAAEDIGYIVIEAGTGTIGGRRFTAQLGADTIRGIGDAPPSSYALTGLTAASTAVVSQAGMDGDNGGWPVLYGSNPVSGTQLQLAVDEDQIGDDERNHTNEQIAYLVLQENQGGSPLGDFNYDQVVDGADLDLIGPGIYAQDPRFDVDGNGRSDAADFEFFVTYLFPVAIGDSNLDGKFDSGDLVQVFKFGEYEDDVDGNSGWSAGDWNGDGDFNSNDLVFAFQVGHYETAAAPLARQLAAAVDLIFAGDDHNPNKPRAFVR